MLAKAITKGPKMLRKWIVCAALLTVVTGAQAEPHWIDFDAGHVSVIAYDADSIVKTRGIVKMWTRETYAIPQRAVMVSGALVDTAFTLNLVNCKERTVAIGQNNSLYQGATIEQSPGAPTNFFDVVPGSHGEAVWKIACRK
jgi:hypothetical protein